MPARHSCLSHLPRRHWVSRRVVSWLPPLIDVPLLVLEQWQGHVPSTPCSNSYWLDPRFVSLLLSHSQRLPFSASLHLRPGAAVGTVYFQDVDDSRPAFLTSAASSEYFEKTRKRPESIWRRNHVPVYGIVELLFAPRQSSTK